MSDRLKLPPPERIIAAALAGDRRALNELYLWHRDIYKKLGEVAGTPWTTVDKTGSSLSEIETRTHAMLQSIAGTGARHISVAENSEITAIDALGAGMVAKTGDATYSARTITGTADEVTVNNGDGVGGNPVIELPDRISSPRKFGTSTDYTEFEAAGTIKFNGGAVVWNDINIPLLSLRSGASIPDEWQIPGTSLYISSFNGSAAAQEVHGCLEMPSDYMEGTDITPHINWCPTTTGLGNVKWILEYSWANGGSTITASTTMSVTVAVSGVVAQEERTVFATVNGTGKLIGSRFVYRLYRDPADAADTYADDSGGFDFGVYYQTDTVGSRGMTTK
jgi:hypothetical protein